MLTVNTFLVYLKLTWRASCIWFGNLRLLGPGVSVHLGLSVLWPPKQGVWGAGPAQGDAFVILPHHQLTQVGAKGSVSLTSGAELKALRVSSLTPYPKWNLLLSILLRKHGSRFQMLLLSRSPPPRAPGQMPQPFRRLASALSGCVTLNKPCLSPRATCNQG